MSTNPPDHPPDLPHRGDGVAAQAKSDLRRALRASRLALPRATALAAARSAIRRAWSLPCLARAKRIALYLPMPGELDCSPFIIEAWRRGRRVYLPVVAGNRLLFAPFHAHSDLQANRFGIAEPVTSSRQLRTARELDVIIAPLVAFDPEGHRLGMGGGYYDRTLAFRLRRSRQRRPHFIALAFELQKVSHLTFDEWDVGLDAVVSESASYHFD